MTRRPWLPYAAWALLVGAVVLFAQPGFSYCTGLHLRLCAKALRAELTGPWDPGQGVLILLLLAIGWTVIAAGRKFGRRTGIAFGAWACLVAVPMTFSGRNIPSCLGPLGITPDQCRAAWGLPPETDWDRFFQGPGPYVALLLAGWLAVVLAQTSGRRQRGGL